MAGLDGKLAGALAFRIGEFSKEPIAGVTPIADMLENLFHRDAAGYDWTFFEPVTRNGLDLEMLRQGSFFTVTGKKIVPGAGDSYGCARELMRYLLRMEQGRIVDVWSSREIKRLLYVTERRIRYASSPALVDAAVYFKSGSLFECRNEPGFICRPYAGNVKNYMNSTAIIESPAAGRKLRALGK